MELYHINSGGKLSLGQQYDHNATEITFAGFVKQKPDSTVYLKLGSPVEVMLPLSEDYAFVVQSNLTQTVDTFYGQLCEYRLKDDSTTEYELIANSKKFLCRVSPSLKDQPEKEVTDPSLDLLYAQMHQAYLKMLEHEETASKSAETAARKATEASNFASASASSASESANSAADSKTAQSKAESSASKAEEKAKESSVSAANARTSEENSAKIAKNIADLVDQIAQNKEEISLLNDDMTKIKDMTSAAEQFGAYAMYHLGFYLDENGDLCQKD